MTVVPGLIGGLSGAIVGSFLATLCIRWGRDEQVVAGRSRCDGCGRPLGWRDLIPLLSYLATRGRCAACGGRIDRLHPGIELASALVGAASLAIAPSPAGLMLALFGWMLLPLAVLDVRHFWLPDRLVLLLAATGLLLGGYLADVPLTDRLIGAAFGFLLLELIRRGYRGLRGRAGLGAGDPKLLGAIGLWLGWADLPLVLLVASAGGLAVAIVLGLRRFSRFPFGTALAGGAWMVAALP